MSNLESFNEVVKYLAEKGVPFTVKEDHINNTISFLSLKITKKDRFWRVNGKVIAGNWVSSIAKFT